MRNAALLWYNFYLHCYLLIISCLISYFDEVAFIFGLIRDTDVNYAVIIIMLGPLIILLTNYFLINTETNNILIINFKSNLIISSSI